MFNFYLQGFYNYITTGDILSKHERIIYSLWNYVLDHIKCKNISFNYLETVSFETTNRKYEIGYEDEQFVLTFQTKSNHTRYENISRKIPFDYFYEMEKWFRKRNYLK